MSNKEEISYKEGCKKLTQGDIKSALKLFRESARHNPVFRPPILRLGELYSRAKRPELAIAFFQRALELQVDSAVLFNLGSESYRLDLLDQSIQYLRAAIKQDARLLKAHLLLAFIYRKKKAQTKAIVYFQNVRKLEKNNRMAFLGESIALVELKKYQEAKELIQIYLSRNSKTDHAFTELRAGIDLYIGDIDSSYKGFNELAKNSKKFTRFTDHLKAARVAEDAEFMDSFEGLDTKITDKTKKLKIRMAKRKKRLNDKKDLTAQKNGIEGAIESTDELKEDLKDMVDLSLLHLFNGDSQKALQFLFQAKKMKNEHKT